MSERRAIIQVHRSFLEGMFPEGTEIIAIYPSSMAKVGVWDFIVSHPSLPEVEEGNAYPSARALATQVQAHYELEET